MYSVGKILLLENGISSLVGGTHSSTYNTAYNYLRVLNYVLTLWSRVLLEKLTGF
jgi:hypothetical protein